MASSKGSPGIHDAQRDPVTGERLNPRAKCIQLTRQGVRCKRDAMGKGSKLCKTHKMLAEAKMQSSKYANDLPQDAPSREAHRQRRARQLAVARRKRGRLTSDEPVVVSDGTNAARLDGSVPINLDAVNEAIDVLADVDAIDFDPDANEADPGPSPEPKDLVKAGITSAAKRSAATTFVLNQQARAALRRLGKDPDPGLDPKRVLLDNVESAWRQRQVWEQMLASIPDEDWAELGKTPIPGVQSTSKGARIEVIQKFLSEATKVSMRSSKLAIDAGIEERLVRLAEEQSALIADTVRAGIIAGIGALARLGLLTPQSEAAAMEAAIGSAANHLRQLAAGVPASEIVDGVAVRVETA